MKSIIKQINTSLIKKQKTIAVAESCTGGLLSEALTRLSGSSKFFILGVIAYSNQAKESILKVPLSLITSKGAVSKEVAYYLAKNVRKIARADFGIGITGIAGPGGGTPKKPVGTVFICVDSTNKIICKKLHFKGSRKEIREKSAQESLKLLKTVL